MLVIGRIQRLAQLLDVALRPPFAHAGLGQGDFDVLAALRRSGPPYSRSPGQLREALMVTSGAVTKQVDRLLAKGLVTRAVSRQGLTAQSSCADSSTSSSPAPAD